MEVAAALYSDRIVTPSTIRSGVILIKNGIIHDIVDLEQVSSDIDITDYKNYVIIPGLIDTHVHVNEPGRTHWEGFETATKSAVAGGITMIIDMPLNSSPVTTTVENFRVKRRDMTNNIYCQIGFHGGVLPHSIDNIEELANAGVFAFKIFTIDSGIDEFPPVTDNNDLKRIMTKLAAIGKPLMVHAELPTDVNISGDLTSYSTYLESRPKKWENNAIELIINLARETNCSVHIIHLSSAEAIPMIEKAKEDGIDITVETCPHYLFFSAEEIKDGQTQYKCAPPIRKDDNRILLWQSIKNGSIDFIASDHSPSPPELKKQDTGNFLDAWGGISSLQFSFSAVLTKALEFGISIETVVKLMSTIPAQFLGLSSKGKIASGFDADLVVIDPDVTYIVDDDLIYHRHKLTPYLNQQLRSKTIATYIRGDKIYSRRSGHLKILDDPLIFRTE